MKTKYILVCIAILFLCSSVQGQNKSIQMLSKNKK